MKRLLAATLAVVLFAAPAHALTTGWASFYKTGRVTANGEYTIEINFVAGHSGISIVDVEQLPLLDFELTTTVTNYRVHNGFRNKQVQKRNPSLTQVTDRRE